jgi:hypothetical protein
MSHTLIFIFLILVVLFAVVYGRPASGLPPPAVVSGPAPEAAPSVQDVGGLSDESESGG